MLLELHIEHLAIIDRLHITFRKGLNILTGETGAGKSIIINALNLILGDKISDEMIRSREEEGLVETLFDASGNPKVRQWLQEQGIDSDDTILIRRILSRKERSRIYINDQLATRQTATRIGEELLNIYGQHQHQILRRVENHMDILDEFAGLLPARCGFEQSYHDFNRLTQRLIELRAEQERGVQERELWAFQVQEIDAARLRTQEEEELRVEHRLLQNAQKLMELTEGCEQALYSNGDSIVDRLGKVEKDLEILGKLNPALSSVRDAVSSALLNLEEASGELKRYLGKITMDPYRLEDVELRLDEIQRLKRKYNANAVEDIITYREQIEQRLQANADQYEEIAKLEKKKGEAEVALRALADELSQGRIEAAQRLKQEIEKELATLGMNRTTFEVHVTEVPSTGDAVASHGAVIGPRGNEELEFLISPNLGEDPRPLSRIASGGELSRIMLAIKKILTTKEEDQTLVFDEVDAGIGGHAAEVVGRKLRELARLHQILCVTHLPQIASFGHAHFRVTKTEVRERTVTSVERIEGDQVVEEIARMLGGNKITPTTLAHAQEMVEKARKEAR